MRWTSAPGQCSRERASARATVWCYYYNIILSLHDSLSCIVVWYEIRVHRTKSKRWVEMMLLISKSIYVFSTVIPIGALSCSSRRFSQSRWPSILNCNLVYRINRDSMHGRYVHVFTVRSEPYYDYPYYYEITVYVLGLRHNIHITPYNI